MKKYTFEDWINGKDEISADQNLFNPQEWEKVGGKQKEIYDSNVDLHFNHYKAEFLDALEKSIDKELFIKSGIESLDRFLT